MMSRKKNRNRNWVNVDIEHFKNDRISEIKKKLNRNSKLKQKHKANLKNNRVHNRQERIKKQGQEIDKSRQKKK